MNTPATYLTDRLRLEPLAVNDDHFFLELVNTEGWLKFIGNRNVASVGDAAEYIRKILDKPSSSCWTVRRRSDQKAIGIVTLFKREYLEHPDIGFAFLPAYAGAGYAYEATTMVLNAEIRARDLAHILATTVPGNTSSVRLLHKLGLRFEKEIRVENELLHVYGAGADALRLNEITGAFFGIFTNTGNRRPDWSLADRICIPGAMIICKAGAKHTVYNLDSFITPRREILSDGTLTEFQEREIREETTVVNNIAQRYSVYRKSGVLGGKPFEQEGNKFFQFIKTEDGWKISSVLWEDEKK